ncbi:DEAD/DEAH box helicase [Mucilaginibacter sp. SMC90]|uniref:DEAD/DEAH box helicase n=1 Tax=Mucilaginibacter sp. SMC90 TaxID=2929803 RepID=UPI001FB42612|nr:DEAD/DEAH box helicase [Mucilaginibacter sp. SMC90]UOE52367.1 DEAD/DEAH box helicase [Mucilaginibacter sp. SMC90]
MIRTISYQEGSGNHNIIIKGATLADLSESIIAAHAAVSIYFDTQSYRQILAKHLEINQGAFTNQSGMVAFPEVIVTSDEGQLALSCGCHATGNKLCEHQAQVLSAITQRDELRVFFDGDLRHKKLKKAAADYGLEDRPDLDKFFEVKALSKSFEIIPRSATLTAVTKESLTNFQNVIVNDNIEPIELPADNAETKTIIVLKQHKYYKYLFVELYAAQTTKDGKIKNPLVPIAPLDLVWETNDAQQLKFFTGVHKFQNHINTQRTVADIAALKAIIKNPLAYNFYAHDNNISEKITASSVSQVQVKPLKTDLELKVNTWDEFYEISGIFNIDGMLYDVKDLDIRYTYFISTGNTLYLVESLQVLNVIELLKKKQGSLQVHKSKFGELKSHLLNKLENKLRIDYTYIKPATQEQIKKEGFDQPAEKIIYLSDFGAHVMIIPVMRYGEAEIPIRTQKQIYGTDEKGNQFLVKRRDDEEIAFTALLVKQHPYFNEQLDNDLDYFYLHKRYFLDEDWFLNVFDEWHNYNIEILGFNELEGNKLNPHKVKININVVSGINWFNTVIDLKFGKKRASLKQIHQAVKNKSKYIRLDDGTRGILPSEWIAKFTEYFNSGEVSDDDTLHTSKSNYTAIQQYYDEDMLDEDVRNELAVYSRKLTGTEIINEVPVPPGLNGTLRSYQKQGLNWLSFLDELNFGGCLADDMGLGKSIQVIAFVLLQRSRVENNTNLIVVPTSLLFNWQQEVQKFAPSIRVHTIYGAERLKHTKHLHQYEIVLTSYGTLLSDINFLKDFNFNYVFLDESQNIKNPESQRYKAARLLKSRNRITITGTPVENNTFDLYGQLSFSCPGLLGSKQYFKDIYAVPIDKFKGSKRAAQLQEKVKPFILRRTKQQVAAELPEKTEMVLYCEMKQEQRHIYDSYEKEFREYISATTNEDLKKSSMNVLKGLNKLRQICDSPMLLKGEKMPGEASAKLDALMDEIESKKHQHKILIFSQFVSMLDLIRKELSARGIGFSYLTGQTRKREQVVNEFQNDAGIRVFLISLKAGGTGLNLTEADYVYLVDPWWNPAVENQAIDRCHRIGQDKKIVAVRLICPGTIEEKIMVMQQSKKDIASKLITPDKTVTSSLSKDDLLNLLT